MANKKSKDILFYIETEVQFDSIKPLLFHIRDDTNKTFDIVVPKAASSGSAVNKGIYDSAAKALTNSNFIVTRSVDDVVLPDYIVKTRYKILMSAYVYPWHYHNIDAKYRIMFPYASYYFNKPNWTIERFIYRDFHADALLSHAVGTKQVTDIFTKTYIVPSLKLLDFKKKPKHNGKPVLFFAPTYDDLDFAVDFLRSIEDLKKEFKIIVRGHHRASYVEINKNKSMKLYEIADKVYDADTYPLTKPLEEADIVISDNSAVIFDAIYCNVPVALFSNDPNSFHYKEINTAQSELVKSGDILWTNDFKKILDIAKLTLEDRIRKRQEGMNLRLFPKSNSVNPVNEWMRVLDIYLADDMPYEYSLAKRYWIESIHQRVYDTDRLSKEVEELKRVVIERDASLVREQNPGIRTASERLFKAVQYKVRIKKRSI